MKRKFAFISLLFALLPLFAQQLPFKTYTRGTGLASDYILSLFQDNRGFLWIGTDRGVSRYDGISFRNFTTEDGLSSNMIYYMFQSLDGAMWFGTYEGGVCRFDGKKFQTFTNKDGLPANSVNVITEDKFGRMYFQTSNGIVMKRGNTFIKIFNYSNGTTRPMLALRNGNLLIPDSSKLYEIIPTDDDRIIKKIISIDSSLKINFYFMNSTAAVERSDGQVVMAAAHNLLFLRKTKSGWSVNRKEGKLYEATGLGEDVSKNLWLGGQFGLERISNESTTLFGLKSGVDPPFVQALLVDREGVIWVGTFGGGLKKLIGDHLRFFTTRDGLLSDNVNTVFPDSKNRIWVGTKNLANIIQNDSISHLHFEKQYAIDQARAFGETKDGTLYLGGFNYIFKIIHSSGNIYNALRIKEFKGAFSGISVINSSPNNNELWLGTYGEGVVHLVNGKTKRITKNDGLVSDLIENISVTRNGVWFLSRNNGATFYQNGMMKNFSNPDEFPSKMIYCVQEENDSTILFGTNKGLVQVKKKESRIFGIKEGLVGTSVLGIIIDSSHGLKKIWVVSDRALHRFENGKLLPYASLSFLPSEDASINQITYQPSTNQLWLATTKGAVRVNLNEARRIKIAPLIHITRIFSDEGGLYDKLTTTTAEKDLDHLVLSYNDNNISFRYASTSFAREEEVRYRYKLEGQDEHWSELTRERIVRYRNLRDGDYTFSVIAINPDGVQSDNVASVSITIMPPFWRTWWLRLLFSIVVLSVIIGTVRHFSTKELKRQIHELEKEKAVQKERERISRDLHDNVGSQLTNIITGIGLAEIYNKAEKPKADSLLHSLQDEARETMTQLRETIRALKSTEISFDNFIIELRKVIERHSKYYSGDLQLVLDDHSRCEIILKPLEALNIFRIVQEAITNSIKYSEAKEIVVNISYEADILSINVIDDGVGMKNDISEMVNGNGIENMKKRADEIGAEIKFTSNKNEGVCVTVTLPIKKKF
ncbi:MAG: two-component regulator propeller domain-containing protein [Ignavibacteriaceae bacterium]|jgi:signal transduction histidine kinase/ligand-binding sensor domain-containing protein